MKWHIVGSNGYIANRLIKSLPVSTSIVQYSRKANYDKYLELASRDSAVFSEIAAGDFVVFLAAISSPDICEQKYEMAYSINVTGTSWFIKECIKRNANVLFLSSDVVYGSENCVFSELSNANPVSKYGFMKYEVERNFSHNPHFKSFRLSYVFSAQDKFMIYIKRCLDGHAAAEVFDALYRNVIYLDDVVSAMIRLGERFTNYSVRIFNLSGPDLLTRKDIAAIYQQYNPAFQYTVRVPEAEFFIARPNVIRTRSLYLEDLLGRPAISINKAMHYELLNRKD